MAADASHYPEDYRAIIHADFDAFYASVEQRDYPELIGKPVVVGGKSENRGVVASASYEARAFGISSAIPMSRAYRLCPQLVRKPPRFEVYRSVSNKVMDIFRSITPLVEPLSLDEAYLDVTKLETSEITPPLIAQELKKKVWAELSLTISVGVGTSKCVAKIASDMNKPDGITVVRPGTEREFLFPLPVQSIWGIGPKTTERLNSFGINTIEQLSKRDISWFESNFGSNSLSVRNMCFGEDPRPVVTHRERKSFSSETTLVDDSDDPEILREIVIRLSNDVGQSLSSRGISGKTVKLKLRSSDFITSTRQRSVLEPIQLSSEIADVAVDLLNHELYKKNSYRLVGVGVSGFGSLENSQDAMQLRFKGF